MKTELISSSFPFMSYRNLSFYLLSACFIFQMAASSAAFAGDLSVQKFPDVLSAKVRASGSNTFNFDVTVSSPYDTPRRYADAFRVMDKDGTIFGQRILVHDHADEQPFERDLYGVKIPDGLRVVVIQARDQKYGYGGKQIEVVVPGR
jgi:hypothetical protein